MRQLPASSTVFAAAFTNASYQQQLVLTVDAGGIAQWQGTGEQNAPLASTMFTTPPAPSGSATVPATILVDSSSNGGAMWRPSSISPVGALNIASYNQYTVVSEDAGDQDWNDCVLNLSWWTPPPTQTVVSAARAGARSRA